MSSKTLLDTLKAVTGELGFGQPSVVLSSQVLTDIQLRTLAVAAGEELLDAYDWQSLLKKYTITIASASLYPLPTDFHRIVDQTAFVATDPMTGSPSSSTWTRLRSGEKRFRVIGDQIEIFEPSTMTGQTLTFYYISKNFVIDATNGLLKADFSLDSDKTVYHARLYTSLVKLKFLQTKNLDTRAAAVSFNAALAAAIGADTPSPVLTLDGEDRLLSLDPVLEG